MMAEMVHKSKMLIEASRLIYCSDPQFLIWMNTKHDIFGPLKAINRNSYFRCFRVSLWI